MVSLERQPGTALGAPSAAKARSPLGRSPSPRLQEEAASASPPCVDRPPSSMALELPVEQSGIPPLTASADSSQGTALPLIVTSTYARPPHTPLSVHTGILFTHNARGTLRHQGAG